jgi:catechol 2,3-dioxygenase-like lactoylglutathione lyase family enzyme
MKLAFVYQSVSDLPAALAFYRDNLGFVEAWREGESTVALELPGTSVQVMLDVPPDDSARWRTGPFFQVDDVDKFVAEHSELTWVEEPIDVPDGRSATLADPAGNILHIFDQSTAEG